MLEDGKISNRQIIYLLVIVVTSTAILFLPTMIYKVAKQDSWLTLVPLVAFGIVVAYIITSLGLMFKDKTIIQYSEIIVGKVLGKIIGLIYCVFFIHIDMVIIREFSELLIGPFLSETPILFFTVGIILASIYAVRSGLEVIARVNEVIFPLFLIAVGGIILMVVKDMEFKNLTPVLAEGLIPVVRGSYNQTLFISEIIVMAMFIPYINIPQKARRSAFIVVVIIGLIGMLIMIGIITVFGTQTDRLDYPFLSLARYVSIAGIIERVEPLILFMWVCGVFVKIAVFHYCAVLSLAQWLNLKDYRPLVVPIGVILVVFSIILWGNIAQLTVQLTKILPIPYLIVEVGIPAVLLITAKLRKKGVRR